MADWMADAFRSGRIIDAILALMVLEAAAIAVWHRASGRPPRLGDVAGTLVSGAALLLAVRAALTGAPWPVIALALLGALIAHATDLIARRRFF